MILMYWLFGCFIISNTEGFGHYTYSSPLMIILTYLQLVCMYCVVLSQM